MRFNGLMPALDLLPGATRSLTRTVDGLADEAYAEPSLLPGWTRGHVVAHLALHAEAMAAAMVGLATGEREVVMYASSAARDADIEKLAGAGAAAVRGRLLAGTTAFSDACHRMPDAGWLGSVRRTPDHHVSFPATQVPVKRLYEVEIHHVDLDAGYGPSSWSEEFAASLIDDRSARLAVHGPLTLSATDVGRSWTVGAPGGPSISGSVADLAWWLSGRGDGDGLTTETGTLPPTPKW